MRQISIIEYDGVTVVEVKPERICYEFDTWEEAVEALPNLNEIEMVEFSRN